MKGCVQDDDFILHKIYPILKLLCNISPKTRDFLGEKIFFCLTYAEGAIIFKIANFKSSCNDYITITCP